LRELKMNQKRERQQIAEYDRQSQGRREALATSFDRERQVIHCGLVSAVQN